MKIKLMVDGSDQRIRITPVTSADRKLLEYIGQWDITRVKVKKENGPYSTRDINEIDLVFVNEEKCDPDGTCAVKDMDYPIA